jgi:hypothetical protein
VRVSPQESGLAPRLVPRRDKQRFAWNTIGEVEILMEPIRNTTYITRILYE